MSSTYSTNLAIELMGTGDQAGTWGTTTNTNLGTLIEQAISGYVTQAVATGTDTTITIPNGASGTARNMFIELTGTGGASTNLIVPSNKKLYFVYNNTSSGQVTVKVSGQTGVSVANGTKVILVSNGTDIVNATSYSTTTGTVTGSGTTNYVTKFTGSTAVGNSVIYDDGTNVGIGTNSPSYAVDIRNAASTALRVGSNSNAFGSLLSWDNSSGTGRLWTLGAYDFVFGVNSTEQMRLTSTGLGIGTTSPGEKLEVKASSAMVKINSTASFAQLGYYNNGSLLWNAYADIASGEYRLGNSSITPFILTSSGNLALGVTPSAWSPQKAMQIGNYAALQDNPQGGGGFGLVSNAYEYSSGAYKYLQTYYAALYRTYAGQHQWFTAPSGTAGNAISFTQAMTLDASGNLGVGQTSPGARLDISSSASLLAIFNSTNANAGYIQFQSSGTNYGFVGSGATLSAAGATDLTIRSQNNLTFTTGGGVERARIDSSGNLLVGTTTSGNKLYVAGGASTPVVAVTFSATAMTVNCQLSNTFSTTFTANVTTAPTISNPSDGQTINWFITQDATGSRTMTWPTSFKWAGGTAGVLSTAANSVDLVVATYRSATGFWYVSLSKAFS